MCIRDSTGSVTDAQAQAMAAAEQEAAEMGLEAVRTQGKYEEKKGKIGKITKKKWYIIDPRSSKIISYWDGIGMVCAALLLQCSPHAAADRRRGRGERARPKARESRELPLRRLPSLATARTLPRTVPQRGLPSSEAQPCMRAVARAAPQRLGGHAGDARAR